MNRSQEEKLDYLLKKFIADSDNYKNIEIQNNITDKKRILRSLMNIRMPKKLSEEVLKVQDEYLSTCAKEKGI
ncbi:protein-ADP-ribose hydrolase, partial [Fusobacterium polymorphum]